MPTAAGNNGNRGRVIIYDHWGHMVSTESAQELHDFARAIGLGELLYHANGREEYHAHYDLLSWRLRERARLLGAVKVRARELVERAWWSRRPLPFKMTAAE